MTASAAVVLHPGRGDFRPYRTGDLAGLRLRPLDARGEMGAYCADPENGQLVAGGLVAWSFCVDGEPRACFGALPFWPGRLLAWAVIGDLTRPHRVRVIRIVRRLVNDAALARRLGVRRLEAQVLHGNRAGHRLAALLGFSREGRMRKFDHEGRDTWMYARVYDHEGEG